jgi:hypothetical protein
MNITFRRARRALLVLLAATGVTAAAAVPAQADSDSLCRNGAKFGLKSRANYMWVSARLDRPGDYYATLQARAPKVDIWEEFEMRGFPQYDSAHNLISDEFGFKSLRNGKSVAAELDYPPGIYALLRARSTNPTGVWERFAFLWGSYRGRTWDGKENVVAGIQSTRNHDVLKVETATSTANYGMVRAISGFWGTWEDFEIVWL